MIDPTYTEAKHYETFAKPRALAYLDAGDTQNAVASFLSDMGKHPDSAPRAQISFMLALASSARENAGECRKWINGHRGNTTPPRTAAR